MRAVTSVEIRPVAASGESGHKRGDPTCRASGESGHKRGDPACSGERAVNYQPMGDNLAAPQGKWSRTIPQSRTGKPSVGAPSRQRERRPGVSRCHPTKMLIGRSARRSGRDSEQDHHHLPSLPSHLRCQLRRRQMDKTKQDYVPTGRDLSKTHGKKSKKPKAVKQTRMSLSIERLARSHNPKRRREGDSPVGSDAVGVGFLFLLFCLCFLLLFWLFSVVVVVCFLVWLFCVAVVVVWGCHKVCYLSQQYF